MSTKPYPAHIYELPRRRIAQRYLQHEFRKLLPSVRGEARWKIIDLDISNWYGGRVMLAPVRDFWNGFHAISMGFKLKSLLPWITSAHITWQEETIALDNLCFGTIFEELEQFPRYAPVPVVRTWYLQKKHRRILQRVRAAHARRSAQTEPRDAFPIIVIKREGKLLTVDGNRRLLRAAVTGQKSIRAMVGVTVRQPAVYEQWIPTQFLLELTQMHRHGYKTGKPASNAVAKIITRSIEHSTAGRYEWTQRCLRKDEPADAILFTAVQKLLVRQRIQLQQPRTA